MASRKRRMAQLGVPFKLQSIPCKCKPSRIHTLKPSLSDSLSLPSLPTFTTTPSLHAQLSIIPYLRFDPALSHPPASPTNQVLPLPPLNLASAFPQTPWRLLFMTFNFALRPLLLFSRRFSAFMLDIMSQLELGKPEPNGKPEKRVNGIFWIILLNIGISVADHFFQVTYFFFSYSQTKLNFIKNKGLWNTPPDFDLEEIFWIV